MDNCLFSKVTCNRRDVHMRWQLRLTYAVMLLLLCASEGSTTTSASNDACSEPSCARRGNRRGSFHCASPLEAADTFFRELLAQISPNEFFETYWDTKPVVLEGAALGRDYSDVLRYSDLAALINPTSNSQDRLQKGVPLHIGTATDAQGSITVAKTMPGVGRMDPPSDISDRPAHSVGMRRLSELYNGGWTLMLNHVLISPPRRRHVRTQHRLHQQ